MESSNPDYETKVRILIWQTKYDILYSSYIQESLALSRLFDCVSGKRRYDRKQKGYGGQTKPIFHKKVCRLMLTYFRLPSHPF